MEVVHGSILELMNEELVVRGRDMPCLWWVIAYLHTKVLD